MAKAEKTWTEQAIVGLLYDKFPVKEGWRCTSQFRTLTGFAGTPAYLDFFAFNVYSSRQYRRVVFEIKVTRADFLHEMERPEKRKHGLQLSNEFYYVCPQGLVQPTEVPADTGLFWVYDGGTIKKQKVAPYRNGDVENLPLRVAAALVNAQYTGEEPARVMNAEIFSWAGEPLSATALLQKLEEQKGGWFADWWKREEATHRGRLEFELAERWRSVVSTIETALETSVRDPLTNREPLGPEVDLAKLQKAMRRVQGERSAVDIQLLSRYVRQALHSLSGIEAALGSERFGEDPVYDDGESADD